MFLKPKSDFRPQKRGQPQKFCLGAFIKKIALVALISSVRVIYFCYSITYTPFIALEKFCFQKIYMYLILKIDQVDAIYDKAYKVRIIT